MNNNNSYNNSNSNSSISNSKEKPCSKPFALELSLTPPQNGMQPLLTNTKSFCQARSPRIQCTMCISMLWILIWHADVISSFYKNGSLGDSHFSWSYDLSSPPATE